MTRRDAAVLFATSAAGPMLAPAAAIAASLSRAKNVVLVHGLFADGSSWVDLIPRLQAVGLNVTAVQNPLTSFGEAVASVKRVLDRQDGAGRAQLCRDDFRTLEGVRAWLTHHIER